MIIKKSSIYIIAIVLNLLACSSYRTTRRDIKDIRENAKIDKCMNRWLFKELDSNIVINVIMHNAKFYHDIHYSANLIIGFNKINNDTVAFLDKNFNGQLKRNDIVFLSKNNWLDIDKKTIPPTFIIYKKPKINDLYCSVDTVYYAKIIKVVTEK